MPPMSSPLTPDFSMTALTVIQPPLAWSPLAWVALVGYVLAAVRARTSRQMILVCYLPGLAYYLLNLYWLAGVTPAGYAALCFYLGWYFVLTGYLLRTVYLYHRWSFTIVLPILWVAQEYLRATMLTGFPWLFVAHSQHDNLSLIQISDLGGAYGVTFLVAMVNGLV